MLTDHGWRDDAVTGNSCATQDNWDVGDGCFRLSVASLSWPLLMIVVMLVTARADLIEKPRCRRSGFRACQIARQRRHLVGKPGAGGSNV
jgi:hypothetical protein